MVRFPFVLWLCGYDVADLPPRRALLRRPCGRRWPYLLLNVSAVFSLSTGGWVLPDGPLMLAMLASANGHRGSAVRERRVRTATSAASPTARWALAGLLAGIAMLSKYHGVFVLAGTFVFLVTSAPHRKWPRAARPLSRARPDRAVLLALRRYGSGNREHGWASFVFQGARGGGRGRDTRRDDACEHRRTGGVGASVDLGAAWSRRFWRADPQWTVRRAALVLRLPRGRPDRRLHAHCASRRGGAPALAGARLPLSFSRHSARPWRERLSRGDARARRWLTGSVWGFLALVAFLASQSATGWLEAVIPGAFAKGDPTIGHRRLARARPTPL